MRGSSKRQSGRMKEMPEAALGLEDRDELDRQVEAVLGRWEFRYVMERFALRRIQPAPYRNVFQVSADRVEDYLTRKGWRIEEFGQAHHLSIWECDGKWVLRYYDVDERTGPVAGLWEFASVEAARREMVSRIVSHAYFTLDYHFKAPERK